ncbi:MAG: hypothetical protein JW723_03675 [Bacteroidales bacterium]|nr:hypothetical protein [Bacteroidales bacterium]
MKTWYTILLLSLVILIDSCKKDELNSEAEFISYNFTGQVVAEIELNSPDRSISISFPETVASADNLVAEYTVSEGALVTVNNEVQISGETSNSYEQPFIYVVRSEDRLTENEWLVIPSNNSITSSWGLGGFLIQTLSNNRDYTWYIDQAHTGEYSADNCGPTSATMAAKWSDESFIKTPEDARAAYRPEGGWWYTDDIHHYLDDNNIPHIFVSLGNYSASTWDIITSHLDAGNICILCLDMYYICAAEKAEWRVDRFYYTDGKDWGHFIIAKGYKVVDGKNYYEIFDPYSWDKTYSDGDLKGKDRYYRSGDIYTATYKWWNHAIVVSPKGQKSNIRESLDISEIEHKWGR